ncbi:hypothetical protein GCM10027277_03170 [Pseudoduganella ginsengisoli]|uniref:Sialate O-acetylesterase domain-containing protein n=1 Tax=Pseudoduganella ginsengisoli TaxID=1462440 RepID=A0A6L6Q6M6_9BURK|nr:sialate O-acetylesterase [Pseudoduganella ginsengisoli]MTW04752.1 hypothetical protein [Pseudoduganella ginsengisoli]
MTFQKSVISASIAVALLSVGQLAHAQLVGGIRPNEIFQRNGNSPSSPANITLKMPMKSALLPGVTTFSAHLLTNGQPTATLQPSRTFSDNEQIKISTGTGTGMSWKKVRVVFYDAMNRAVQSWDSADFAVGDVFLIAGQSNAANHSSVVTSAISPFNRAFNPAPASNTWSALTHTQPYASSWADQPWGNAGYPPKGSPWGVFAEKLSASTGVPVGIVNTAWGGSPLAWWANNWSPTSNEAPESLFNRLVKAANAVGNCGFKAVLWHQGESDAPNNHTPKTTYGADLMQLARNFRNQTQGNCDPAWMIAKVAWVPESTWTSALLPQKFATEMNHRRGLTFTAKRNYPGDPKFLEGPDSDILTWAKYRYYDPDPNNYNQYTHFNEAGIKAHGGLWASYVGQWLNGTVRTPTNKPEYLNFADVPEYKQVWDDFKTTLGRSDAENLADAEGMRYWTEIITNGRISSKCISAGKNTPRDCMNYILSYSPEKAVRLAFAQLKLQLPSRVPTQAEINYWTAQANAQYTQWDTTAPTMSEADKQTAMKNTVYDGIKYELTLDASARAVWGSFINVLSRTTPQITSDSAGFNWWLGQYNAQPAAQRETWRTTVMEPTMKTSEEYIVRTNFYALQNRQPDNTELTNFINYFINNGRNEVQLRDAIFMADLR